ncbi:MAG TPA: glycosyltransferase [Candidatus Wunengus sp. YC60]|uniref:glycosyltransferase n=1 Tax=Candidatus Wunengus sp. YC60 TaxID=3367697 RepID=UPI0040287349
MTAVSHDVVMLSTADWDNPFWTNKQHVAVQLAASGYRVFYIDSLGLRRPSASAQDIRRILNRLQKLIVGPRQVRENICVWSPFVVPLQRYSFIRRFNRFLMSAMLKFYINKMGIKQEILWTYNPLTVRLLNIKGFKKIIYHCVDDIKAQPGMPVNIFEQAEKDLVERSHIVFATSPKLMETRMAWNPNTYYFPNVADFKHFSKARDIETIIPGDLLEIPAPRIGFIGAISDYKVDFNLLRCVAKARPGWSIVLIGKVGEGDPWTKTGLFQDIPNIHIMGPRPYAELPCYLKGLDVTILPNVLNEYTESMFPMKFFEYLAAGKPVVSVDLSALREYRNVVYIARSLQDFIRGIDEALKGNVAPLEERILVAKEHTYEIRTNKMLQLIETLPH